MDLLARCKAAWTMGYHKTEDSVLLPLQFRFFVFDIEFLCVTYEEIKVFKFADDDTVKVTVKDLEECLFTLL